MKDTFHHIAKWLLCTKSHSKLTFIIWCQKPLSLWNYYILHFWWCELCESRSCEVGETLWFHLEIQLFFLKSLTSPIKWGLNNLCEYMCIYIYMNIYIFFKHNTSSMCTKNIFYLVYRKQNDIAMINHHYNYMKNFSFFILKFNFEV